jgi:hypothetical protein
MNLYDRKCISFTLCPRQVFIDPPKRPLIALRFLGDLEILKAEIKASMHN